MQNQHPVLCRKAFRCWFWTLKLYKCSSWTSGIWRWAQRSAMKSFLTSCCFCWCGHSHCRLWWRGCLSQTCMNQNSRNKGCVMLCGQWQAVCKSLVSNSWWCCSGSFFLSSVSFCRHCQTIRPFKWPECKFSIVIWWNCVLLVRLCCMICPCRYLQHKVSSCFCG